LPRLEDDAMTTIPRDAIFDSLAVTDSKGIENREQHAIALLHAQGHYSGLTCGEERKLDAEVWSACFTIDPPTA